MRVPSFLYPYRRTDWLGGVCPCSYQGASLEPFWSQTDWLKNARPFFESITCTVFSGLHTPKIARDGHGVRHSG